MTEPNLPLLNKVMDHIEAHPEEHHQATWGVQVSKVSAYDRQYYLLRGVNPSCGTAYCFAGHAINMAGGTLIFDEDHEAVEASHPDVDGGKRGSIADTAKTLLGISSATMLNLFAGYNTREELRRLVDMINAGDVR